MSSEFEAGRLRQSWTAWKASVAARQPDGLAVLRPPACDANVQALRDALDGRWSPQLEALHRENDGEGDAGEDEEPLFLYIPEDSGISYYFMPLSGIDESTCINGGVDRTRAAGADVADPDPGALLVPFGKDFSGKCLCVALPHRDAEKDRCSRQTSAAANTA